MLLFCFSSLGSSAARKRCEGSLEASSTSSASLTCSCIMFGAGRALCARDCELPELLDERLRALTADAASAAASAAAIDSGWITSSSYTLQMFRYATISGARNAKTTVEYYSYCTHTYMSKVKYEYINL